MAAVDRAGRSWDSFNNNNDILNINSPDFKLDTPCVLAENPYCVVYKNELERWAVVALDWINGGQRHEPALAIRWFWGDGGFPQCFGRWAAWFIMPKELSLAFLDSISEEKTILIVKRIKRFLYGSIDGRRLNEFLEANAVWCEKRCTYTERETSK